MPSILDPKLSSDFIFDSCDFEDESNDSVFTLELSSFAPPSNDSLSSLYPKISNNSSILLKSSSVSLYSGYEIVSPSIIGN